MMNRMHRKYFIAVSLMAVFLFTAAGAQEISKSKPEPLTIQEQGSFAVGGSVTTAPGTFDPIRQGAYNPAGTDPAGQTLRGDHAYVFYQVPVNARKLPLVFWHGHGQSAKTWETTPDGRGSASSGSAPGRTSIRACSFRAILRRSISSSGRWSPTPAHTTRR